MPTKFRPTERYRVKDQGMKTTHYYIKLMSKQALFDYINSVSAVPKRRVKCIRELQRRGIKIDWVSGQVTN